MHDKYKSANVDAQAYSQGDREYSRKEDTHAAPYYTIHIFIDFQFMSHT